jgi:hypothetical protein
MAGDARKSIDVKCCYERRVMFECQTQIRATENGIRKNGVFFSNTEINFGIASFFVSPARHGEAQDMSGTWKRKIN